MLYYLYLIGSALALSVPLKIGYRVAEFMGDIYCFFARKDRQCLAKNLEVVLKDSDDSIYVQQYTRLAFRNFAKYLVDFFRFPKLTKSYITDHISISGRENLDKAWAKGKGVILLSAHLGNWELGGAVLASLGYPLYAIVLEHADKRINKFFTKNRNMNNLNVIPLGIEVKRCFSILRQNKLLAIVGDKDFTDTGAEVEFFGRPAMMPKGPAVFSLRTGAPIVPAFMVRTEDDTCKLILDAPIYYEPTKMEQNDVLALMTKCMRVIEDYVKMYPDQWYVFRDVWEKPRLK